MSRIWTLPFESVLLVVSLLGVVCEAIQIRDDGSLCSGGLSTLNFNGKSPCTLFNVTQALCGPGSGFDSTACACNLIAYNLQSGCLECQSQPPISWSQWAQQSSCQQTDIAANFPFNVGVSLPSWAHDPLTSNEDFDLASAVKKSSGWTPVQIAAPIITAVCVAIIALILFWYYRRRIKGPTSPRKRRYQEANLQGPRRFFGLLPATETVRPVSSDTKWGIDDAFDGVHPPLEDPETRQNQSPSPFHLSHSRLTSVSSLLPLTTSTSNSSRPSSRLGNSSPPLSPFQTMVKKISSISLAKKYTVGVAKGPEYKRVAVQAETPNARFKIDEPPTPSTPGSKILSPLRTMFRTPSVASRPSPLPSVLDIRRPSGGSVATVATDTSPKPKGAVYPHPSQSDLRSVVERDRRAEERRADDEYDTSRPSAWKPRHAPSDYSLTTNDLMTPITPRDYPFNSNEIMDPPPLPCLSPRPDSMLLPEEGEVAESPVDYFFTSRNLNPQPLRR